MRKFFIITFVLIISFNNSAQSRRDLDIQEIVAEIDRINLTDYVRELDEFGTRFMLAQNRYEIVNYLLTKFRRMGYFNVTLDTFRCYVDTALAPFDRTKIEGMGSDQKLEQINVVASIRGSETPENIYIICAHYDTFCVLPDPYLNSPGADDNAGGVACLFEIIRAIMKSDYRPKSTIKFICLAANKLGSIGHGEMGSQLYIRRALAAGENIKFIMNLDRIGFTAKPLTESSVNVTPNEYFPKIDQVLSVCREYGGLIYNSDGGVREDFLEFTKRGIPGIMFEESDTTEQVLVGTIQDRWYSLNYLYLTEVAKAAAAVLVSIEDILTDIEENNIPTEFALEQNYPNPFNPSTTIEYRIKERMNVSISVFNILGEKITELVNEEKPAGSYKVVFTANDLPTGIYFYSFNAGLYSEKRKMILLK